jgi:hypothetical protein
MRSRDPFQDPNNTFSATFQYLVRFVQALSLTGWNGLTPPTTNWFAEWSEPAQSTDRDIFLGLLELELQLANQWAGDGSSDSGAHLTNKVTAGFAKAGIFLIPLACIDGDPATTTKGTNWCPNGESGADAVIDVDDDDPTDDPVIDGVTHREGDYLKRDGSPPKFHIWTGPRYVFQKDGTAMFPQTAPCNTEFQVEVSNNVDAQWNLINPTTSGFIKVRLDTTDLAKQCYGEWVVPQEMWKKLNGGDKLYYRATTRDASGQSVRTSTAPGNGLFQVPPPYAIVNTTGRPPAVEGVN